MMSALFLAAAAAGLPAGPFDCEIKQVAAIDYDAGKVSASMIEGVPSDSLKFALSINGSEAIVDWPNSPIQANGKQHVLSTGNSAGMILMVSPGPCLFTERACASMINFAQQSDGSLKLLVSPTALSTDKEHDVRFPFMVYMDGNCVVRKH